MKTFTFLAFATGIGLTQALLASNLDSFAISWRGTLTYNDGTGRMVRKSYTEKDVVNKIAENNGLDARNLILVYRPDAFDTAVVDKSTNMAISDYLQLPDIIHIGTPWITDVTGNGQTVRQAFLFDQQSNPIGSIVGTEKQKRDDQDNITSESFHGTFQYASQTGSAVLLPGVYSGSFSTGRRITIAP
jgi:hypothetical protein